ncbi:MAG: glycosyltransferase family 2 protein [Bacteroidota bacterium]
MGSCLSGSDQTGVTKKIILIVAGISLHKMAIVSVIIPNYNHEKFLERRFECILQQTFQDFEIIILDDASTDNSRDILERYRRNPKVSEIVYNEQNSGSTFRQWQKGIEAAKSEWIWIAESDDYCDLNFLELLAPACNKKQCVLAYNELSMVDSHGAVLHLTDSKQSGFISGKRFLQNHLLDKFILWNAGMLLFRKDIALNYLSLLNNYVYSGDQMLWSAVASNGSVYASGKYAAYFLYHENSLSSRLLFSKLMYREQLNTYTFLQNNHLIRPAYISKWVKQKMAEVFCARKGLPSSEFKSKIRFWRAVANQNHIAISYQEVWLISKMINLRFAFKKYRQELIKLLSRK